MSGANVSPIGRNKEEWLVQATDYRKLNEPPRPRLQRNGTIYLMARPPLLCRTTARRGGCVIKENLAKPPKETQPGWFSFWIHRKTTPASRKADASRYFLNRSATPPCGDAKEGNSA